MTSITREIVFVPAELMAEIWTTVLVGPVRFPVIRPVLVLRVNPDGNPTAEYEVAEPEVAI